VILTFEEFVAQAKAGYRIPLVKELSTSSLSPVAIVEALRLQQGEFALLESGKLSESLASSTFICYAPGRIYRTKDNLVYLNNEEIKGVHPYRYLEQLVAADPTIRIPGQPKFCGGPVGFISYDAGRMFEHLPELTQDDLKIPDLYFMFCDRVIEIDNLYSKVRAVINIYVDEASNLLELYTWAEAEFSKLEVQLESIESENPQPLPQLALQNLFEPEVNMTKEQFKSMVVRAKEYIKAGDVFQVNLSIRLGKELKTDPWNVYKVLRRVNPSPYAAYVNFGDIQLVGSSPELLVKINNGIAETRPIAGTRRRGLDREEDLALAKELINNEKECAEHIMLVDLERNDLGRVCSYGTVKVDELMVIEEYSHVMHIVSNVQGELAEGKSNFDLLKACFPGGTITGCPKVRCMEIIEELEPTRRGVYTGSVGYFGYSGEMEMNISIRTLVVTEGKAYVQAGAGIVVDSIPEREYYESLKKAEALLRALELAEQEHD
jgi:anthranilate/para-aminobenzoate synthase component I